MTQEAKIGETTAGTRLDSTLPLLFPPLSRSQSHELIVNSHVHLDGKVERRPGFRVKLGQHVTVDVLDVAPGVAAAQDLALDVVYEDTSIAVINKPPGMVVHPSAGHESGTVANAVLHRFGALPSAGGTRRPGIVHRLDRDTSGLIVLAKSEAALANLMHQFASRTVGKEYLALARGTLPASGAIDQPLARDPHNRLRMAIVPGGRRSMTRFERLRQYDRAALLRVHLDTGRTHQIRVHLAAIGHPVVGDVLYGGTPGGAGRHGFGADAGRQFLHASRLAMTLPATARRLVCTAALPADLTDVLAPLADEDPRAWSPVTGYTFEEASELDT